MERINPAVDLDLFFNQLASADHSALLLDYDGTLAPFCVNRDTALPYPGVIDILEAIQQLGHCRLAIVSGRTPEELTRLLPMKELPELFACHGAIHVTSDGRRDEYTLPAESQELLSAAREWSESAGLGQATEWKQYSIAFHWRGVPEKERIATARLVKERWEEPLSGSGVQFLEFDGGLELRASGIHKGLAVQAVLNDLPESCPIAYLGDDMTDEDAFRTLGQRGLKLLVRSEARPSLADFRLNPPVELLDFLGRWLASMKAPPTPT